MDTNEEANKGSIWVYIAIATIPLVLVLGNSMLVPILPDMQEKMGISRFQSSLVITLFSISAGLIIPVSGYLSDRFTRKAVIIPSLIVYGAAGVLAVFAAVWNSYPILITARAIQGLGAAGTAPIAMALVGDLYKGGQASKALGLIEASNGTGKVVSPIIGSLLALITWYAPFFAFPIFCVLSLLAVIFLIKEPPREQKADPLRIYLGQIRDILRQKGRWLIPAFFAGSITLFILFGVLFYLSQILEEEPYRIEGVRKGFVLAIPLLGMVITSYTTGAKIKQNGTLMRWLMNIGLTLMTVALAFAIFLNSNLYVFIGLLTLSGIGTGLLLPCLNTLITGSVERDQRGMITSLYNSLRFIGVAFGPPLFGWLMSISHKTIFTTVSSMALLMLILVFFCIKPSGDMPEKS
ncbi:putative MFS-type transporter YitG [Paenibacillus marchantiophytorum]|uniref:MFS-type transporter YitG n=1 Tax=Paenibacillus marchantiophytorum TaxID=1619310 RepID=A0ABQ2BQS7_9BACL|nr:MFS transporter [Paenibacillus marchantiophytorum]GGI45423.1 putative MFS-type transporter YitG [Paenibacillus marchantiophytorum]